MKKTLIAFAFLAIGIMTNAQPIITSGEYWFNNDYAGKIHIPLTPGVNVLFNSGIDCSQLNTGMHNISFRFKQSNGIWSAVGSQLFLKVPELTPGGEAICEMEYWINNDYSTRISLPITSTTFYTFQSAIDLNYLSCGIHTFNFRFKQNNGSWSNVTSQLFNKTPPVIAGGGLLKGYEYWIDDDYQSKTSQPITGSSSFVLISEHNFASVPTGMHHLNIRFQQADGSWSSTLSEAFIKVPLQSDNRTITAYEYWFDDEYNQRIQQQIEPTANFFFAAPLDVAELSTGLHNLNMRFRQDNGIWSSSATQLFMKQPVNDGNNFLTTYEYWFNTEFENRTIINGINEALYTTNSLINIENSDQFINIFHARFKDLNNTFNYVDHYYYSIDLQIKLMLEGLYSVANGQMRKSQNETGANFNGSIADTVTVEVHEAVAPYNLLVRFYGIELNTDGTCHLQRSGTDFINLPGSQNTLFHLVIKHRNSIETWSQAFEIGPVSTFNFTDSPQKAYGENMVNANGVYLIYAGDVNQDGTIDTGDMSPVDNDAANFATGYLTTDVNGDGTVDTGDMTIVDNNASGFVGAVTP
ncbi:MAG: hypothetical protein PHT26_07410 [Lentimicrobiaceae bacterium]|nr:hypothetical protein [Lentimicrobiaceae bacterium]